MTKHTSNQSPVTFVTHKCFAVVFFLPSCCVNSNSHLNMSTYAFFLAWLFSKRVCYQKYGCFKSHPNLLVKLPQNPSRIGIRFNLFTRANRNSAKLIDDHNKYKLTTSHFKISRRTIFVIHGFTGKGSRNLKHLVTALIRGAFHTSQNSRNFG